MIDKKYLPKAQNFVPGIYGGMGPLSHVKFEEALIEECSRRGIKKDQDFPVWLLASGASTPDRTLSISGGPTSLKHLIYFSKFIQSAGADFLVLICNTAHFYKDQIENQIDIPIISIIEETANYIARSSPLCEKVGLIATDGTVGANLYQKALSIYGIETVVPNKTTQREVMDSIYNPKFGIKATGTKVSPKAKRSLEKTIHELSQKGAELIITGCTEVSIGLSHYNNPNITIVDPLKVLSSRVIEHCFAQIHIPKTPKRPENQKVIYDYKFNLLEK